MQCALRVRDVIALYLAHLEKRQQCDDYSRQALDGVRHDLERFASRYGERLLADCRKFDMTEWMDANPQWRSAWTRKRILETIARPFVWAEDQGLIDHSPYRAPKRMRKGKPRRAASVAEYVTLMRGASRELRRALFFMRRTGVRTHEMREVLWSEVDFGLGVIVRERHKSMRQTAEPLPRMIGLDRATLRFLTNLYRQRRPGQLHVFVNCDGGAWDRHTFARHMNRWATRLGLDPSRAKLSPYCFRHTYGATAVIAGIGERQIADQMGHSSTRMVAYYAKTAGKFEYLRQVAEDAMRRRRK